MSTFTVAVTAKNIRDESRSTPPVTAVVDSGSELTWLPGELLREAGIEPRKTFTFRTATGELATREVGFAVVEADGYVANDEVVFAEPGDMTLLGVRTLEGFAVVVDYVGHRFVARTVLVAANLL